MTGPDGPVGGVEVTLTDGTTTVTTRTATAGDIGRWRVDGLTTPSTYLITASSDSLGAQSELLPLAAAGSSEVDLTLQSGVATISGTVLGTDSLGGVGGLGGLTVTATDGTTTRTATTVTGGSTGSGAGTFVLPGLPVPKAYTVTVEGPGYATVTREVQLTPAGVQGWEISVSSVGGAVSGTVRDDAGAGIPAVGLVLSNNETTYKTMSSSDDSGTYRFSGIDPGVYVLSGEAFGHETTYAEVTVTSGGTADVPLVLTKVPGDGLVATSTIVGRVTDAGTGGQLTCPVLDEGEECVVTATVVAPQTDGSSVDLHGHRRARRPVPPPGRGRRRGSAARPLRHLALRSRLRAREGHGHRADGRRGGSRDRRPRAVAVAPRFGSCPRRRPARRRVRRRAGRRRDRGPSPHRATRKSPSARRRRHAAPRSPTAPTGSTGSAPGRTPSRSSGSPAATCRPPRRPSPS